MADQVPQVPSWVPKGGLSFEEGLTQQSEWHRTIGQRDVALSQARLDPEVRRRLQALLAEAEYQVDKEDYAEADAVLLKFEWQFAEARLGPLAKHGEKFDRHGGRKPGTITNALKILVRTYLATYPRATEKEVLTHLEDCQDDLESIIVEVTADVHPRTRDADYRIHWVSPDKKDHVWWFSTLAKKLSALRPQS